MMIMMCAGPHSVFLLPRKHDSVCLARASSPGCHTTDKDATLGCKTKPVVTQPDSNSSEMRG
eukprot:146576-Rhodomonas_salina.1